MALKYWTEPEGEFRAWTMMGVEKEAGEFLYGLVRMLKPRLTLESGTGEGYATSYLARGIQENGIGKLYTYEADSHFAAAARENLAEWPWVQVKNQPLVGYDGPTPDLVFLDSGPPWRPLELAEWLPRGVPLVVHDAHEYPQLTGGVMLPGRGLWLRV